MRAFSGVAPCFFAYKTLETMEILCILHAVPRAGESRERTVERASVLLEGGWDIVHLMKQQYGTAADKELASQDVRPHLTPISPKRVPVLLENVDWVLLRKQKQGLVNFHHQAERDAAEGSGLASAYVEVYAGLIHLLDQIQDQAALVLGEKAVFGDLTKTDPSA